MGRLDTHFALGDPDGKKEEEDHVRRVFRANGYPDRFVRRVVTQRREKRRRREHVSEESNGGQEVSSFVSLPYIRGMSEIIANPRTQIACSSLDRELHLSISANSLLMTLIAEKWYLSGNDNHTLQRPFDSTADSSFKLSPVRGIPRKMT